IFPVQRASPCPTSTLQPKSIGGFMLRPAGSTFPSDERQVQEHRTASRHCRGQNIRLDSIGRETQGNDDKRERSRNGCADSYGLEQVAQEGGQGTQRYTGLAVEQSAENGRPLSNTDD